MMPTLISPKYLYSQDVGELGRHLLCHKQFSVKPFHVNLRYLILKPDINLMHSLFPQNVFDAHCFAIILKIYTVFS